MGVYHLMGLGRSVGAVIGPLSYLAYRYQRWDEGDQVFFGRSGEEAQRQAGRKVGDMQALVLFTTRELLIGKLAAYSYIYNPAGKLTKGPEKPGEPIRKMMHRLLKQEWPRIAGGRREGCVFWCEVDRRDIRSSYERIVRVVAALAGVGGQGKEMWINLTGGNNVINFALELAATLSGDVARLYYVQAENPTAEKCVRFTAEDGYWVDLPVMPLVISRLSRGTLELLHGEGPMGSADLYGRLSTHEAYWSLVQGVSLEAFEEVYLTPMWKQGLLTEDHGNYTSGPQWALIRPYEQVLQQVRADHVTMEQLAAQEPWIDREEVTF